MTTRVLARQVLRQVGYELRAVRRNPAAAFFTVLLPLVLLVILGLAAVGPGPAVLGGPRFVTPGIMALAVVTACYTGVAMSVAVARDAGVLKRVMGTPLPLGVYLAGRIGQAVVLALALVLVIGLFGALVLGVTPAPGGVVLAIGAIVVAAPAFAALGLAITTVIPDAAAAPAVVNATVLPLVLVSNVLLPLESGPLAVLAALFPVRHFADALLSAYGASPASFHTARVGIVALWGIVGLAIALRRWRWAPAADREAR